MAFRSIVPAVLLLGASLLTDQPSKNSRAADLASMVDAERAFAAAAKTKGIKAAFLEYLDDEAVALQPTLSNAKEVWRGRNDPPDARKASLTWEPRIGDVASSGNLGWLSGPYVFVPGDNEHASYGCYFSVWMRSPEHPWRVALDQGIDTEAPCQFDGSGFRALKATKWSGAVIAPDAARARLLAADGDVGHTGEPRATGAAIAEAMRDDGRVYRPGRQIFVGSAAARVYLVAEQTPMTTTPVRAVVSRAQDLGYTYGKFEVGEAPDAKQGYYLRVWARLPSGAWAIVADILTRVQ